MIRAVTHADAAALAHIYNHYILNTIVTFEEQSVAADEMAARIATQAAENLPWLVAESAGVVVAFAYASKWKGRCAYRFSAESTVYVDPGRTRSGLGTQLYRELLERLTGQGLHAVMGGIALPNPASIALHERFGFKQVAQFEQVGHKFGRWIDVGYWQRML